MNTNYKLYLYKPAGQASDFLGELLVDNLNAQIKLHDISTISFTIPESINGVANPRLDQVLDSYVVELRYGKDVSTDGGEHSKIRFTIFSTPLEFSDNIRKYSYTGYSLESLLEFKNITNWAGIEVKDFFRTIKYNNNAATPRFTEPGTPSNFSYTISTSSNTRGTKYITINPTTATATPLDIFVYEVRQDTTVANNVKEVPYVRYTGTGVNDNNFRDGYYFLTLNGSGNITSISIAVAGNYINFNGLPSTTELFFKLYDNPLSRHFAIGVNRTTEDPYTDMYVDLAHQADLGDATPTYGDYTFSTQTTYSKNGLKLEQVLLGRTDTRDGSYDLINNTPTTDGLLYSTGFTIGTIDPVIAGNAAETILPMYRSNLEFNNITRYQAIKDLAESFDAIVVFNTVTKTVSFYPQDNSLTTAWPNNGLIIKYGTYLQSITKEIDASKIVTSAKALGKNNVGIALITPDGNSAWEDFSYYLDDYYISDAATQIENIQNNGSTGITFDYVDTTGYQSRWMEATEAEKIAKWQYARDYFHQILLGELDPSISAHDKYFNLYNLRSEAINDYVVAESKFIAWRALQYKTKYLYDYYYNLKQNGNATSEDLDRLDYYEELWLGAQTAIAAEEQEIEDLRKEVLPANDNEIVADSIADYLSHIRNFLDKSEWSINLTKLEPFIRQTVMSDNKLDNDLDLLKATITHVNENKVPKVTLKTNIVSIISAQEAYEDWNKLKAGDLINIYFDEFNIDLVAQIKEVSIDFEQHTVDLTISTVHNYNTGYGKYVAKTLRRLYNSDTNITKHLEDANRISSEETAEVYNQLNNGSISADNSQITLGSTNSEGTQSTSFSATGVNSLVIESVDTVLEIPTFSADKGVAIADGTVTAYYDRGAGDITTEVEISGANGFVIRNTDNDTGVVSTVAYIDETDGTAYFAGWKLGTGQFSAGSTTSFVGINSETPVANNTLYAFWAGNETASSAPFSVTKAGAIKATAGTIAGLNVGTGYISTDDKNATTNPKNAIFKRASGGAGVWGENETAFYLDEDGRFSLSNELTWNPATNTFFVNGEIQADIGNIGGWKVDDNTLTSVDNSNVLTPNIQLDRAGRILVAGSTFDGEYIDDARIIIDNTGITGSDGTNTTFKLTTDGILTNAAIKLDSGDYSIRIGDLVSDGIQSIAGNFGLIVQNDAAAAAVPYQVIVSEEGFFITTIDGTDMADKALAVQYDYDRIWAKRLVISDILPEDSTLETEEQALLEASTLIGRLSSTEHGVRVVESYESSGTKYNIIKMSTEGFAIYQNKTVITNPTNPTFEVLTDGSISATSLKISGTSELGGWTVDNDSVSAGEFVLQYDATNPYLSIKQSTNPGWYDPTLTSPASDKYGIFLGYDSNVAKMSLASSTNYLVWDGSDLKLKGNLSGEISAINIYKVVDNIPDTTIGVRITSEGIIGSNSGFTSFELRSVDGRGLISGWNFDNEAIYTGTKTATGNFTSTNGHITIGSDGHISAKEFRIDANGDAFFAGELSAASGSFSGQITANSGSIAGFTIENTILTAGSLSAGASGSNVGLTPDSGANNISIWAGASIASGTVPTNAEVAAAPFRVTNAGAITATLGTIGGFTIGANFLRSGADNTKLLLQHNATNPYISIGQSTNSYDQPGIFLGLDSVDNKTKLSINPLKTRTFNTTSGSTTLTTGDTTDLTPGMLITGSGILAGTYIESITNSTTLEMTGTSNTTASGVSLSFTNGSFTFNGASLGIGGYNFSALGLSGSGSIRRASLNTLYDISLDYDEFYMKSDAAGPSDYSETFVTANSLKAAYYSLSGNPIVSPSVYYTGTLNDDSVNFTYQNSGVNTNTGSIILKPFTTPSTGSYTISMPYQTGTIALINAVQTYTSEPIFSSGAVFGSAADAANSIEITSTGNIIFEGSTANGNDTILTAENATAVRTITLPNASGTVALTSTYLQTATLLGSVSRGATNAMNDTGATATITDTSSYAFILLRLFAGAQDSNGWLLIPESVWDNSTTETHTLEATRDNYQTVYAVVQCAVERESNTSIRVFFSYSNDATDILEIYGVN